MRRVCVAVASALVLSAFAGTLPAAAAGQPEDPILGPVEFARLETAGMPSDRNAALVYLRAWLMGTSTREMENELASQEYAHPDRPPGSDAFLLAAQDEIAMIMRASMLDHADWGIESERGFGSLLPELSQCRQTARVLGWDAARCREKGEFDAAAERTAAVIGLARHISEQRLLISSLVGTSLLQFSHVMTRELVDSGELTAYARDLILSQLGRLDADDPSDLQGAIRGERDTVVAWIKSSFTGPGAGTKLSRWLGIIEPPRSPALRAAIMMLDETAMKRDLDKLQLYYDDVLAALDADDPDSALATVVADLESGKANLGAGKYGLLATLLGASFHKAIESRNKSAAELAAVRDLLQSAPVKP